MAFQHAVADGVHQVSLAQANAAVHEEGVVDLAGVLGYCQGCRMGKAVGATGDKGIKGVFRIQGRVISRGNQVHVCVRAIGNPHVRGGGGHLGRCRGAGIRKFHPYGVSVAQGLLLRSILRTQGFLHFGQFFLSLTEPFFLGDGFNLHLTGGTKDIFDHILQHQPIPVIHPFPGEVRPCSNDHRSVVYGEDCQG